jgi:hypothetical protein
MDKFWRNENVYNWVTFIMITEEIPYLKIARIPNLIMALRLLRTILTTVLNVDDIKLIVGV